MPLNQDKLNSDLQDAVLEGAALKVENLIRAKADVNIGSKFMPSISLFYNAVQTNKCQIVKLLIDGKADINRPLVGGMNFPIYDPITKGRNEMLKLLLDEKGDPNIGIDGISPLSYAFDLGSARQKKYATSPAIFQETVKILLENKADPNQPFHVNDTVVFKMLLDAGCTMKTANRVNSGRSSSGSKPLITKTLSDEMQEKSDLVIATLSDPSTCKLPIAGGHIALLNIIPEYAGLLKRADSKMSDEDFESYQSDKRVAFLSDPVIKMDSNISSSACSTTGAAAREVPKKVESKRSNCVIC